jgi:hypothetical protein
MNPALILFVVFGVPQSSAEERPQGPLPSVTIKLAISTDAYDPSRPSQATIKCSVINKSDDLVEVRVGYDSRVNVLQAEGDHLRWGMTLYPFERSKEKLKPVSLKPGEGKVLYELSLDEVLLQRPASQGKPKWAWDWRARPKAPPTPIHRPRDVGFVEKTMFWAKTAVNDKWLSSERVELKVVKPSSGEKPGR